MHYCTTCLHRQERAGNCDACGGDNLVDIGDPEQRAEFAKMVARAAYQRRRRYLLAMEAMLIVVCAGVLFVGLTVAAGLGGGAVEWGVKIFVVVLLATGWKTTRWIYGTYFKGAPEKALAELVGKGER